MLTLQMDNGAPLDVNSELTVVGWSNVASGLLGGFTGSYIFSQTVFTCRSGAHSRIVGAVVAVGLEHNSTYCVKNERLRFLLTECFEILDIPLTYVLIKHFFSFGCCF